MAMTYGDLLNQLNTMTHEQLNMDVTVFVTGVGEFYSVVEDFPFAVARASTNDVLDDGHPYLVI